MSLERQAVPRTGGLQQLAGRSGQQGALQGVCGRLLTLWCAAFNGKPGAFTGHRGRELTAQGPEAPGSRPSGWLSPGRRERPTG